MDSVNLSDNGRTAILNYASYKSPGGFFLEGSPAQEEALCHESNLYPILLAFDGTYYAWLNKALYLNRALVVFERNDKQKKADVITCAAPNFRTAHRYQSVSKSENDRVLENRIHFMYQIAEENGVENLVAGAWGCGVFMQDPYTVATLLIGAARNYNIPNIYFAIPRILEHIARKDLNMSPGKLAEKILWGSKEVDGIMYHMDISLDTDLFHDWITKVVCRAKNKDDLLRAVEAAKELIKITF